MRRVLRDGEHLFDGRTLRITMSLTDELPAAELISAVHCIGFSDDGRVLLARHVHRSWTIPGGHVEAGESLISAVRREAMEEACAVVRDERVVAVERIVRIAGPPNPRYPQPAHQVFFVARVVSVGVLEPNAECTESALFPIEVARGLPGWLDHNQDLFDAAVTAWSSPT